MSSFACDGASHFACRSRREAGKRLPTLTEELQRPVVLIALYADSLLAQILAASTFPEQVVEAHRWLRLHPDLKGDALGQAAASIQRCDWLSLLDRIPSTTEMIH